MLVEGVVGGSHGVAGRGRSRGRRTTRCLGWGMVLEERKMKGVCGLLEVQRASARCARCTRP